MRHDPHARKIEAIACPGCRETFPVFELSEHMATCPKIGFPTEQPVPPSEPLLGLATTRELLTELAARMEIGPNGAGPETEDEQELATRCRTSMQCLSAEVLGYRTVVGHG